MWAPSRGLAVQRPSLCLLSLSMLSCHMLKEILRDPYHITSPKEAGREEFNHVQESGFLEQGRVAQGPVSRGDFCPRNLYGFNGHFPASLWLTDPIPLSHFKPPIESFRPLESGWPRLPAKVTPANSSTIIVAFVLKFLFFQQPQGL